MWTYLKSPGEWSLAIGLLLLLYGALAVFFFLLLGGVARWRQDREESRLTKRLLLSYYRRQKEEEDRWLAIGEEEKLPVLYRLDRLIDYSGIRYRLPFFGAELLIILGTVALTGFFLLGLFTGLGAMAGLMIGAALCLAGYIVLRRRADRNYDEIENGLFAFVNVVGTQSRSSDDLITVLDGSVRFLCPPLKRAVEHCCHEARNTGRLLESLHHLERSVENEEFQKIIRNLAMCYRTDADYCRVIEECRVGLKEHIASREEQRAMTGNHRLEMAELIGIGALSFVMIGNIIGERNVFAYLRGFALGRVVLYYLLAVMLWCFADLILSRGRR